MKRLLSFMLAVTLILGMAPQFTLPVLAADTVASGTCGTNVSWTLDADGLLTISGSGRMTSYGEISSYRSQIKSLVIEDGVTSVYSHAFYNSDSLITVYAPGVTELENYAFGSCNNLETVYIPAVVTIGDYALNGCTKLKEIDASSLVKFGDYTFGDCASLTEVILPSAEIIGYDSFYNCTSLKRVYIPKAVSVDSWAFENCTSLKEIIFLEDQPTFGSQVFNEVTATAWYPMGNSTWGGISDGFGGTITWKPICAEEKHNIVVSNLAPSCLEAGANGRAVCTICGYVTEKGEEVSATGHSIVDGACLKCDYKSVFASGSCGEKLTWVMDSDGHLVISGEGNMYDYGYSGETPWAEHTNLVASIVLEEGVTGIGQSAFADCVNLRDVTIPSTLTQSGVLAFDYCDDIENVYATSVADWCKISFEEYHATPLRSAKNIYFGETKLENTLVIPEGVTNIAKYAFCNLHSITTLGLPSTLKTVEEGAFSSCYNIDRIDIPSIEAWLGIDFLGYSSSPMDENDYLSVFINGSEFSGELIIPEGIDKIGSKLFKGWRISSVKIPEGVTNIGSYAFSECYSLSEVFLPSTLKYIGEAAFANCNIKDITFAEGLKSIGDCAFQYCPIKSLSFPSTLTYIGYSAFDSASIATLVIPGSCKTIGGNAFNNCSNLTSVTIDPGVSDLGYGTFEYCYNLSSITIGEGPTSIGMFTFQNCDNLKTIVLPNSVKTIGSYAFCDSALESITLGSGLVTIENGAFQRCYNLKKLQIPENVNYIEGWAFENCSELNEVYFVGNAPTIESDAFNYVEATCYYPANNETWTDSKRQQYGGTITWVPEGVVEHTPVLKNNEKATCTEPGYSGDTVCSECGEVLTQGTQIPALGHDYNTNTVEPSCMAAGSKTYTCSRCSDTKTETYGEALGHSFTTYVSDYNATCTADGTKTAKCDRCEEKDTVTDEGTKTDHTLDNLGVCTVCGFSETLIAHGTIGENITWILDKEGKLTISGEGEMSGYGELHDYLEDIVTVIVEEGVTSIAANAFEKAEALTSVTLPMTVTEVGASAFRYCYKLATVVMPGVTTVNANAFEECEITTLEMPSVVTIGGYAFNKGVNVTELSLPMVKTIGSDGFAYCAAIQKLYLPSIENIGAYAFYYCSGVKEVIFEGNRPSSFGHASFYQVTATCYYPAGDSTWNGIENSTNHSGTLTWKKYGGPCEHQYASEVYTPGCESTGFTLNTCTLCGHVYKSDFKSALGHSYGAVVTAPTCTAQGYTTHTCGNCGDSYVDTYVEAKGHQLSDGQCTACGNTMAGEADNGFTWELDDNGNLTITGTGNMADYSETVRAPWYEFRGKIKKIILSDGITGIGKYAFHGCNALVNVTISKDITVIGDGAFSCCIALKNLNLPENVEQIGEAAFLGCTNLLKIALPKKLTKLHARLFEGCIALKTITIHGNVTEIGESAFADCSNLVDVNIPENVTVIHKNVFKNCRKLAKLVIPANVTVIGEYAFAGCAALSQIQIPETVTEIGVGAFEDCETLVSMDIPVNVILLHPSAFRGCGKLKEIKVHKDNRNYCSVDGLVYDKNKTRLVVVPCGVEGTVTVSDGVTEIGESAFAGCAKLEGITVPDSVQSVGDGAFSDCTTLVNINLSVNITVIGKHAFRGCSSMVAIVLPDNLGEISEGMFEDCIKLKNVNMKHGIKKLGKNAFAKCYGLTEVEIPDGVEVLGEDVFLDCHGLTYVKLGSGMKNVHTDAFKGCKKLEKFGVHENNNHFKCHDGVLYDKEMKTLHLVPKGRKNPVEVPETVELVKKGAFKSCYNGPTTVFKGEKAPEIEGGAYEDTDSECHYGYENKDNYKDVKNKNYGGNQSWLPVLSADVHGNSGNIKWTLNKYGHLTIESADGTAVAMDDYGPNDTPWLAFIEVIRSVEISDDITHVGDNSFNGGSNIGSIHIGSGVGSIGGGAFSGCGGGSGGYGGGGSSGGSVDITFDGDKAPTFDKDTFKDTYITLYHPAGSESWEQVKSDYRNVNTIKFEGTSTEAVLKFTNLTLEGRIQLNFIMEISDALLADPTATVSFCYPDGTEIMQIPVSEGKEENVQVSKNDGEFVEMTYYKYSIDLAAKEMADTVKLIVKKGDTAIKAYSYSIRDYADQMMKDPDQYANVLNLLETMLDYGAYAQLYFGHNTKTLANKELTDQGKIDEFMLDVVADDIREFANYDQQKTKNVRFAGSSLVLESETTLRLFFEIDKKVKDNVTFTYNGQKIESKVRDEYYYIDITGIAAKDLDRNVEIVVNDGKEEITVTYNALSYCHAVLSDHTGRFKNYLKELVAALVLYNRAADAYFQSK